MDVGADVFWSGDRAVWGDLQTVGQMPLKEGSWKRLDEKGVDRVFNRDCTLGKTYGSLHTDDDDVDGKVLMCSFWQRPRFLSPRL
ncbi:jg4996 [Pararge aegeria aegeria]|uniref:Jg4996 protein n=1 Tax=Pararge aegeria aegeria TaxID=348720 RepID=A0A8S4QSF0_9NEOP|nr:jg4996 [Pararge aegeria aegeria]